MVQKLIGDKDYRVPGGCGIFGVMNQKGNRFSGETVVRAMVIMNERTNGLGAGFAGYGIYPDLPEYYCFHLLYDNRPAQKNTEEYLHNLFRVEKGEKMPVRDNTGINCPHLLWRYFLKPKDNSPSEDDFIVQAVMKINLKIDGAFVISSGKNMGIFKGVGFPEEIAEFFCLEEYQGYIWTGHSRFPTNTVGWWGGAHPFGLLDWSVVHNGEVSSYGINRRYLINFGYNCSLHTDTEVLTYLLDLLARKQGLDFEVVSAILAAPFWDEIERLPERKQELYRALRIVYGGALVNGPFSIIAGSSTTMLGLNDRIKLRPLVAGTKDDFLYLSSEEAAIREVCPVPDKVWMPEAGKPTIGKLLTEASLKEIGQH